MYQNQYTGSFLFLRTLTRAATRSSRYSSHYKITITEPSPLVFSVITIAIPPFLYQIPVSGYPHFYKYSSYGHRCIWPCVNALSRAIPISTICQEFPVAKGIRSVNALSRAIPISTRHSWRCTWRSSNVSMPCLGLSPFLHPG